MTQSCQASCPQTLTCNRNGQICASKQTPDLTLGTGRVGGMNGSMGSLQAQLAGDAELSTK